MTKTIIQNLSPETRDVLEMMYAVKLIYKISNPTQVFKKIKESILDGTFPDQTSKQNFNFVNKNSKEKKIAIKIFQTYSTKQFDKLPI